MKIELKMRRVGRGRYDSNGNYELTMIVLDKDGVPFEAKAWIDFTENLYEGIEFTFNPLDCYISPEEQLRQMHTEELNTKAEALICKFGQQKITELRIKASENVAAKRKESPFSLKGSYADAAEQEWYRLILEHPLDVKQI